MHLRVNIMSRAQAYTRFFWSFQHEAVCHLLTLVGAWFKANSQMSDRRTRQDDGRCPRPRLWPTKILGTGSVLPQSWKSKQQLLPSAFAVGVVPIHPDMLAFYATFILHLSYELGFLEVGCEVSPSRAIHNLFKCRASLCCFLSVGFL